jgi:DNA-binding NarL/FixJ family response regulator
VRVLVAARDVRVRRALSRLLELDGHRIVGATDGPHLLPQLDADLGPDLVVLELDRREDARDLEIVDELTRGGRAVVAVCSGRASCAGVLAAGAEACLDKDAAFPDRLTDAVRLVAAGKRAPAPPAAPG